ncbi:uncharacterized protein CcaverHIS019_0109250 [Cutaneotrichosporon cavernicola]|uniref:Arf-GAP domain-containing protein n=1 Tax=Cutaneotrichosporon cavernicola TaxID=279322 RepID=A0AA48L101_9TREE|nr:uncharacterized protein CcaverHIS019_0109250 [Cutaneotrichosporon cavernicola]BEI88207.1 hypothetical protein CcaverHIS019_0109250 [Cutaneotrichosporon cavernicola]BEI95978.1 hypothetical protein CcaverHIS631_0109270 [Cutaneotrichosporon cavernicola]BEJ03752.1 hypothetical protein CcaverHIS641_0109270 [Cutaneotrichosporon cavernicola]
MNAQQRIERQLDEVLKMPGNDRCADCRAAAPRWASVNLGIFLCVTCASIHRKMGTHKSRVKSVTLDEWTREQVMGMKEMGNTKSNAIYNPDPQRHPPPATVSDERDSEIQKFIRRKYELGAFKAGAGRDLATASVNSRTQALQARGLAPPRSSTTPPPDTSRYLPAVPTGPSRRPARSNSSAPVWVSLGQSNTGSSSSSSSNSLAPPVTPAALPTRSASRSSPNQAPALLKTSSQPPQQREHDLLVDIGGSASSTRPLQLAGFPTIPAAPSVSPLPSPSGPALSPLALGQQAFFQQFSPTANPTNNPFGAQYGQTLSPMGSTYTQNPMGANQVGMNGFSVGMMGSSPNGMSMGMMGSSPNGMTMQQGMMGSSPNGMTMQQGMMMSPTGMGMNGAVMGGGMGRDMGGMGGVQMAQPVQYQQQQQQHWQSGYM